jgi:hypothetical protein
MIEEHYNEPSPIQQLPDDEEPLTTPEAVLPVE